MQLLTAPSRDGRAAEPVLQGHGHCVLAVLAQPVSVPGQDRADYLELVLLATPEKIVTIRKTGAGGELASVDSIAGRVDAGVPAGEVFHAGSTTPPTRSSSSSTASTNRSTVWSGRSST